MKFIYSLFFFLLYSFSLNASHISYEDLTYKCLGGLTYEFTLTLYRDCGPTAPAAPASITLSICSPSTGAAGPSATLMPVSGTGIPVYPVCSFPSSMCTGGSDIGFFKHVYKGNCTFPSAKADWTVRHVYCCREPSITNIVSPLASGTGIMCLIDNLNYPGNSSPTFNDEPVLFACCNQSFAYNQSATDIDGDSLVYSLYHPLNDISGCTTFDSIDYLPGFTYLQPVTSSPLMSMNALTGYLTIYPIVCNEISVMGVKVEEYRGGNLIGYIERDNMIIVTNQTAIAGVSEKGKQIDISIFPNPVSERVSVILKGVQPLVLEKGITADLINTLGEKVLTISIVSEKTEVNMRGISCGIYFFQMNTGNKIITKKIIKE